MELDNDKSLYKQIENFIESSILRDIFIADEQVPSTNELAKMYSINPATAAKGINLLVDNGILYKKRGIGMFVSQGAKDEIIKMRKSQFYDTYIVSLTTEAANLGINRNELIEMISNALDKKL